MERTKRGAGEVIFLLLYLFHHAGLSRISCVEKAEIERPAKVRFLFLHTNMPLCPSHMDLTVFCREKKLDFLRTHTYLINYVGRE